jgi:hypothetical protein
MNLQQIHHYHNEFDYEPREPKGYWKIMAMALTAVIVLMVSIRFIG